VSTPAGTGKDSAKRTEVKVWGGVIVGIEVMFPPGPQGDLKVAIRQGGWQIAPTTYDTYFAADDETIKYQEFVPLKSGYNNITIITYNDDAVNAHLCRVRINVLPAFLADPSRAQQEMAGRLDTLLKRIGAYGV